MSGMKFRLQCAGCGATFFAPDRKARYCPKCVKKGASRTGDARAKRQKAKSLIERISARLGGATRKVTKTRASLSNRARKIAVLTPESREQVAQLYQERFAGGETPMDEMVAQISDRTWVTRKAVKSVINNILHPRVPITPELNERIIEMYKGFVERSERPARGRRRTIAEAVGVPLSQVMKIVHQWSLSQHNASPTPELSRLQRFEIEKLYWDEIERRQYRYGEIPEKIAERLGYANVYQIRRLLDMFYDDCSRFKNVPDPPPEAERKILEAYKQYLAASQPPKEGLHFTIAHQIGGLTARQVHKVLQRYRYQRRDEYPLK